MESNRVLLSDRYGHKLSLTQQEMGIACHALSVLAHAFNEEPEYFALITVLWCKLSEQLEKEALTLEEL